MKTRKLTKKQKEQQEALARRVIGMALKKFSAWELIEMIKDISGNDEYKTRDEHISEMEFEGYKMVRVDDNSVTVKFTSLQQQMKFDEFIEKLIPYYSDQQTQIQF